MDKLRYFAKNHLMGCDLSTEDIIEIFNYSMPLYYLYHKYDDNNRSLGEFNILFKYIAQKDYENAMKFINGADIPHQKEIKVAAVLNLFWHDSLVDECNYINLNLSNWFDQLEIEKPDLFIFDYPNDNYDSVWLGEVLKYCNNHQISTVFLSNNPCENSFIEDSMNFDYILTSIKEDVGFYRDMGKENVYYIDIEDNTLKSETKLIDDADFYNSLVNQYRFRQILDKINYKHIPDFKYLVLAYKLNDLDDLIGIYNNFNEIKYPLKHIKLITDEYSFLSDSISPEELEKIRMNDKFHCLIVND